MFYKRTEYGFKCKKFCYSHIRKQYLCIHTHTHTCTHMCVCARTRVCVHECVRVCVCVPMKHKQPYHRHHVRLLEKFHQNCIWRILNIKWFSCTHDAVVLERAFSTEKNNSQTRCLGWSFCQDGWWEAPQTDIYKGITREKSNLTNLKIDVGTWENLIVQLGGNIWIEANGAC